MDRLIVPLAGLAAGGTYGIIGSVLNETPSALAALCTVVTALVTLLAWTVRHLLSKSIPAIQASHERQIKDVCATFRDSANEDRALAREQHKDLLEKAGKAEEHADRRHGQVLELLGRRIGTQDKTAAAAGL
jgi:hypothetical protein